MIKEWIILVRYYYYYTTANLIEKLYNILIINFQRQ